MRRRRLVAGGALATALVGCAARAPWRDDSAAAWFARWLAAFNAVDPGDYPAFVRDHVPSLQPFLDDDLSLRETSGGFELLRHEATAARELTAWVRERRWGRVSRVVLTSGNGRIDDIAFLGAGAVPAPSIARLDEASALAALRERLDAATADGSFSGVVQVARHDELLLQHAGGRLAPGRNEAITADTRFCIGSMGKMFTAVLTLQLAQERRLALDETVAALLPDHPATALARSVTVRHLLCHTGGTGDFMGALYDAHRAELREPADFVRLFGEREPAFAAGARWGYSNYGYVLLAAICARVGRRRWDELLAQRILRRAGMVSTSSAAAPGPSAVPCTGATQTGLKPLPHYTGTPAGGAYASLADLHRFDRALHTGRLLDAVHLALLTTAVVPAGERQWSHGLRIVRRDGVQSFGHAGSAPGISADFAVYPASGHRVIVLCNRGHPLAAGVAGFIGARLPA